MADTQEHSFAWDGQDVLCEYMLTEKKLDELEKLSKEIDSEIRDSRKIFDEAQNMYEEAMISSVLCSETKHKDLSTFLNARTNFLLPDMGIDLTDLDLNESIRKFQEYIEKVKNTISTFEEQEAVSVNKEIQPVDFEQCAVSLQQMINRVNSILNLSTNDKLKCNSEFEDKFSVLCNDVELFTKMIEAQTKLSGCSENCSNKVAENTQITYEEIFSKLLGTIHELSFLVENIK